MDCMERVRETDSLKCRGCGKQIAVPRRCCTQPDYYMRWLDACEQVHRAKGCRFIAEARQSLQATRKVHLC
jgi:transcription elongation factor Elf1